MTKGELANLLNKCQPLPKPELGKATYLQTQSQSILKRKISKTHNELWNPENEEKSAENQGKFVRPCNFN